MNSLHNKNRALFPCVGPSICFLRPSRCSVPRLLNTQRACFSHLVCWHLVCLFQTRRSAQVPAGQVIDRVRRSADHHQLALLHTGYGHEDLRALAKILTNEVLLHVVLVNPSSHHPYRLHVWTWNSRGRTHDIAQEFLPRVGRTTSESIAVTLVLPPPVPLSRTWYGLAGSIFVFGRDSKNNFDSAVNLPSFARVCTHVVVLGETYDVDTAGDGAPLPLSTLLLDVVQGPAQYLPDDTSSIHPLVKVLFLKRASPGRLQQAGVFSTSKASDEHKTQEQTIPAHTSDPQRFNRGAPCAVEYEFRSR